MENPRKINLTVNNFIQCGDKVLFLQRAVDKKWDPNKLNGVGGKVEPGEEFLAANDRETREETGLTPENTRFFGIVRVETEAEEWIVVIFKSDVPTTEIPNGTITSDGQFLWLNKEEATSGRYEFVGDLQHYFQEIFEGGHHILVSVIYSAESQEPKVAVQRISI